MNPAHARRLLMIACACALAALGLMVWSVFDPRVVPVIVAMSIGQVLGIASFAVYLGVVVVDVIADRRGRRR
jgi:hypothetical protein